MGYPPPYPPYPPYGPYPPPGGQPASRTADRVISILVLAFTGMVLVGGAFMGLMMLAFLDHCPRATCSVSGAVGSVVTAVGVAAVVSLAGLVVTVVRMARRLTAWPFAVGTLGLCVLALFGGGLAYFVAVGG
ncbi:MAG: hypothetical protein KDB71_11615 [Mycobacterium sp.]|nr:hypothetical protein [Mycobacterium sp.]